MRRISSLGLLLAVCTLSSCVETQPNTKLAALSEGCLLNSDCNAPLVCVFRRCHNECQSDADCPAGSPCVKGDGPYNVCLLNAPPPDEYDCTKNGCVSPLRCAADGHCRNQCDSDVDCVTGQVCTQHVCVAPKDLVGGKLPARDGGTSGCTYQSDCPGQACVDSRCVPQCKADVDCPSGSCSQGRCVTAVVDGGSGKTCNLNSECALNERCGAGGKCVPQCVDARDCNAGQQCVNQACLTPGTDGGTSSTCALNSDCPPRRICGVGGQCVAECKEVRDCVQPGQVCVSPDGGAPGTEGACVIPGSTVPAKTEGASCSLNSDCNSGLRCSPQGKCVVECRFSVDCSSPALCVSADGGAPADGGVCRSSGTASGDGGIIPAGTLGATCSLKSDCNGQLVCRANACAYECNAPVDCATACCVAHACYPTSTCSALLPDGGLPQNSLDAGTSADGGVKCSKDLDCADGIFCNGNERCEQGTCRSAARVACDDNNPCSLDNCNETQKTCSYSSTLTDSDGDGHYPLGCGVTADDCDDSDPFTWGGSFPAPERCDFKDNNCNDLVDEGLWAEKTGSRVAITAGDQFPANISGPRAVKSGNEIIVLAASDQSSRGSLDLFRLDSQTLSVAGPVGTVGSSSPQTSCIEGANTWFLRRAGQATLEVSDAGLFVSGLAKTSPILSSQCCQNVNNNVDSVYALVSPSFLAVDGGTFATESVSNSCQSFFSARTEAAIAHWVPAVNRFVVLYAKWTGGQQGDLLISSVNSNGTFTTPKKVVADGPSVQGSIVDLATTSYIRQQARFAVGPNGLLVAWFQPSNNGFSARVRYVLLSNDLTTTLAGPFDLIATPGLKVEDAYFDGARYGLVIHEGGDPVNNSQSLYFIDPMTLVPVPGRIELPEAVGGNSINSEIMPATWRSAFQRNADNTGFFTAATQGNNLRFGWGVPKVDAGVTTVDVPFPGGPTSHTDFALAPVDSKHVVVFWADGEVRRLVMECAGP